MFNKRVLVTGGAGFIGSELVSQLLEQGYEVVVVDNLVNGKPENLPFQAERLRFEIADIRNLPVMAALMQGTEIVYHLACLGVRHSLHNPVENHAVNATGTLELLELARQARVPRFVYVSSSEVYGTARQVPMTERHETVPMTVYGGSKLAGESYARAYYQSYNYPTVVVRPFNSFGPRCHHEGDSGEVIPKFMLRAMAGKPLIVFGDGLQTRDFTFVSDTARGILLAGTNDAAIGHTLNLGQGEEITINDLAQQIAMALTLDSVVIEHDEPRPGDVMRLFADSSAARDLLGFSPTVSLRAGLKRLHKWYLDCGKSVPDMLSHEQVHSWEQHRAEEVA